MAVSISTVAGDLLERFGLDPSKRCRTYSKGNRQKVLLIAALAQPAELLILDEPTSGLDPLMEVTFRNVISDVAAQGTTVLLSSHILFRGASASATASASSAPAVSSRLPRSTSSAASTSWSSRSVSPATPPSFEDLDGVEHLDTSVQGRIRVSYRGDLNLCWLGWRRWIVPRSTSASPTSKTSSSASTQIPAVDPTPRAHMTAGSALARLHVRLTRRSGIGLDAARRRGSGLHRRRLRAAYPTVAERARSPRRSAPTSGFQALYGRAFDLTSIGGFTAWRLGA